MTDLPHCPSCSCGRRAPVMARGAGTLDGVPYPAKPEGTVAWAEHCQAWEHYALRFGTQQSAKRMAERGGFSYAELCAHLGHEPTTWRVRS